jgi:hypothetical protein
MECQQVKLTLSAFQDGCVVESERREIAAHVKKCRDCAAHLDQLSAVRRSLRAMPRRPMPANLAFSLRSMASRESSFRRRYAGFRGWVRNQYDQFSLFSNNLMRPIALPAAGGLASAVLLFSMVMTNFQGIVRSPLNDIPLSIATDPSVKNMLLDVSEAEFTVDVFVDEQGRVIDYSFPDGYGSMNTSQMRRKLENSLLFTEFSPATSFGQPTSGWVRMKFKGRSEIDVQG